MSKLLRIVLLEDKKRDAEKIKEAFNETMGYLKEWEMLDDMGFDKMEMEWIRGSEKVEKRGGQTYFHYMDKDFDKIQKAVKKKREADVQVGILMDVLLTKEEEERAEINLFSQIEYSKKIMDTFDEECNIYIITGLSNFGSRAWGIYMRENMVERYIHKELVRDYSSRKAMARALYWMYHRKIMDKILAERIEEKELE